MPTIFFSLSCSLRFLMLYFALKVLELLDLLRAFLQKMHLDNDEPHWADRFLFEFTFKCIIRF